MNEKINLELLSIVFCMKISIHYFDMDGILCTNITDYAFCDEIKLFKN